MDPTDLLKTPLSTSSSIADSSVDNMMKAIPLTHLGVAITVDKMIPPWVVIEVKELTTFYNGTACSWKNRLEVVVDTRYLDILRGGAITIFAHDRGQQS